MHFYTNPDKPLDESLKDLAFIGDVTSYDINSTTNLKYVFQKIIKDSVIFKDTIETTNQEINDLVFEAVAEYHQSINFDPYSNLEKILKAKDVRLDVSKWANYCDKIMDVVSFYSEFTNKKLLLFHNLERLLTLDQLNELNDYIKSVNLIIVSLESYPMRLKEEGLNVKLYSIDEDHIRFDY